MVGMYTAPGAREIIVRVSGWSGEAVQPADPARRYLIDSGPSERGTHRLMTFLHCPTLFAYLYRLNLAPDARVPLVLGSLVHTGLAHYYARIGAAAPDGFKYIHTLRGAEEHTPPIYEPPVRVTDPNAFCLPDEAIRQAVQQRQEEGGIEARLAEQLQDQAISMVARVVAGEQKHGRTYQRVVSIELPVEIRCGDHYVTTKLDLVTEVRPLGTKDLKYRVIDHKTAARPGDSATLEKYAPTLQLAVMRLAGRHLFKERYGGTYLHLVDSVGETGGRMLQPEPGPHLERKVVDLLTHAEQAILKLDRERPNPWTWPMAANEQSCTSPYGKKKRCEGWDLCLRGPSEGDFVKHMKEINRDQG